jgi:hypothetical protein
MMERKCKNLEFEIHLNKSPNNEDQSNPLRHFTWPCLDGPRDPKIFAQYPSHRIFGRLNEALNIGKKTNCTVCL